MAAGTQPAPPKREPMSDEKRQELEDVLHGMSKAATDIVVTPDGPIKAIVDMTGQGEYRQKLISPGQEFIFDHFYLTKTGQPTGVFKPADAQDWNHAEFDFRKLDAAFPSFGGHLADKMGLPGDLEAMNDIYRAAITWREHTNLAQREEQEAEIEKIKDSNPLWGRF
jgi:hypothetical protein